MDYLVIAVKFTDSDPLGVTQVLFKGEECKSIEVMGGASRYIRDKGDNVRDGYTTFARDFDEARERGVMFTSGMVGDVRVKVYQGSRNDFRGFIP